MLDVQKLKQLPRDIMGMVELQLSSLSIEEQVVAKWASVLGEVFNRRVLVEILPYSVPSNKRNKIVNTLIRRDIFCCAGIDEDIKHIVKDNQPCCNCDHFTFRNRAVHKSFYSSIQSSQHLQIHNKAALCYESMFTIHKTRVPYYLLGSKDCDPDEVLALANSTDDLGDYSGIAYPRLLDQAEIVLPLKLKDGLGWNKNVQREILLGIEFYYNIIYHWRRAEYRDRVISNLIELVSATLAIRSFSLASRHLQELRYELDLLEKGSQYKSFRNSLVCTIHRLQGEIYLLSGNNVLAENEAISALVSMGFRNIHSERDSIRCDTTLPYEFHLQISFPLLSLLIHWTTLFRSITRPTDKMVIEKIRSFVMLYQVALSQTYGRAAKYYAYHLYRLAQSSQCPIHFYIKSYAIVIDALYMLDLPNVASKLEMELYMRVKDNVERLFPDDYYSLAVIFGNRSFINFLTNSTSNTILFAHFAVDVFSTLDDGTSCNEILPPLIRAEVRYNMSEIAISIKDQSVIVIKKTLNILKQLTQKVNSIPATACYISSCVDVLIETGFPLEKMDDIIKFAEEASNYTTIHYRISLELINIYVGLSLWYARHNKWAVADSWYGRYSKLNKFCHNCQHDGNTLCKIIEFNLLRYSFNANTMSVREKTIFKSYIDKKMDALSLIMKYETCLEPRALHLDAYWQAIVNLTNIAQYDLNHARDVAKLQQNNLEIALIKLHLKLWTTDDRDALANHQLAWPLPHYHALNLKI